MMDGTILILMAVVATACTVFGYFASKYGHKSEKRIKEILEKADHFGELLETSNRENHQLKQELQSKEHELFRAQNTGRFLQEIMN